MPDAAAPPMARPLVAAGLLIRDGQGRVLLVNPTYKPGWDIPGGLVEPGESPGQAAAREVVEEVGLRITPGALLVVDWAPHPATGDRLLFVFDGGVRAAGDPQPVPDGDEIGEVRFWPVGRLDEATPARLARRLRVALRACSGGEVYAEHGDVPAARRHPR